MKYFKRFTSSEFTSYAGVIRQNENAPVWKLRLMLCVPYIFQTLYIKMKYV